MSQTINKLSVRRTRQVAASLLLTVAFLPLASISVVHAESLFRITTKYNSQEPLKPRSLFTPPISREVGDLVTINITETTTTDTTAELKVTRTQVINQNGSTLFNTA